MTSREKEILELIRKDPMITQQKLAKKLGITRSSIAVHIGNLMKKGYIKGKGYILKNQEYVTVIGGANIDIQGFSEELIYEDSNPGKVKMSLGGVGRNIAENLVNIGINTKLVTVVGDDIYGDKIYDECRVSGIDINYSIKLKEGRTSTYISISEKGDMKLAVSDMGILDYMDVEYIRKISDIINSSKIIVLDTNMPMDVIDYLVINFKDKKFFLDPVSTTKAEKVKDIIGSFHTIKPNKYEAEILSGIKIKNRKDIKRAGDILIKKGVKKVYISLGKDGIFYSDGENSKIINNPKVDVINATGAGDAFLAGLVYSELNKFNCEKSAIFSMGASILALSHEDTINYNITVENINKKIEELNMYERI
ncbi:MAG: winged helix-turn-helix transcriptional regulator [Firmicutes bacterium]|nr:winged helix-turn-helix transcriptional regulator [Bacillota bacterium]